MLPLTARVIRYRCSRVLLLLLLLLLTDTVCKSRPTSLRLNVAAYQSVINESD